MGGRERNLNIILEIITDITVIQCGCDVPVQPCPPDRLECDPLDLFSEAIYELREGGQKRDLGCIVKRPKVCFKGKRLRWKHI